MHTSSRHAVRGALTLLAAALVLSPLGAQAAAPKKTAKPAPAKAAATGPMDPAYEQWLKKYGAYDRIVSSAEDDADASSDNNTNALKLAEGHLLQGTPQLALSVIENLPAYADPQMEIQRLWLGGQAFRSLGDPYKAVIWYSHAAKLMDDKQLKARLSAEPGLDALWVDVWRRQFWAFVGNPSSSREALELTLRTLLGQAETAWGPENFWLKSKEALALATGEAQPAPAKASKDKDAPLVVSAADRLRIAQAVAASCLEDYDRAGTALSGMSDPAVKEFWSAFLDFLASGKTQNTKTLSAAGYAKPAGFWSANLLAPYSASREEWFLGSSTSASWLKFRNNLRQLPHEEARAAVDKEMQSLLLSEEMSRLLRSFKLILLLEDGDTDAAREIWGGLDKRKLPICLRLAGGLVFQEDQKTLLPQEIGAAAKLAPTLSALLAAGGIGTPLAGEAPFWTRMEVGRSSNVNKLWPLDRLLVLADWQARWAASPGPELARRSAFLFPDTSYGYGCLVYLTQQAVDNRAFQMAEAYLTRMEPLSIDKTRQVARLGLKARMERESGKDDDALQTFHQILDLGVEFDPKTRLDMATFLQLKNDFAGGRKQLLILWDQRDKLSKPLQAEVLFWLGEGEHSQRNYDAALDYYLRLAFQYPQEPMWPTVALYRAAMIYEIKGKFETARKFLIQVMNTAERKEEREAAKNRLNALDAKAGRPTTKDGAAPVYPF